MGVSPFGAQVRRTEGRSETPLSSWKTIQAFRRRAFFLLPAISGSATAALSPRRVAAPAWRAVAASSPSHPKSSTHGQRDSAPRWRALSRPPLVAASTDPCRSHAPAHLAAMPSLPAVVVHGPTSACAPHGQPRAALRPPLAAIARTNGSRSGGLP